MTVTFQRKAAAFCRSSLLSLVLVASAFAGMQALAQSTVTNTATISPPDGATDANPANDSDDALVSVTALPPPFGSCSSDMYLTQGPDGTTPTTLYGVDTSTNPFTYPLIGTGTYRYNSSAFNPQDNYLYALGHSPAATNLLLRIGSDGIPNEVGVVAGLPATAAGYNAGEIAPDGFYYVHPNEASSNQLYRIDLATLIATPVTLSVAVGVSDLAWHDGALYGVSGNTLHAIDPTSGATSPIGPAGVAGSFGAMFGASNGVYGSHNTGGFYRFDLITGAATLISSSPASAQNDGAKCATTPMEFPADLALDKDDGSETYVSGEDVVYTIVASNLGPFGVQGATVDDPLPAGITTASWTCGSGTDGGTCGVASGSGAIADVPVNLPAGATVTFTLTLSVPSDFTGDLVNVATVTSPPEGSPDPNLANNTDDDTDTLEPAVVTVEKTSSPVPGTMLGIGDTLTYTVTTTVAGGPTSDVVTLTDTLSAGLAIGAVTDPGSFSCSGELVCTLPAGTPAGTYALTYTAVVGLGATGTVSNTVVPTGGDGPTCGTCTTQHPVQPNFGSCDATIYLGVGAPTQLVRADTSTNPLTYPPIGSPDATGYNAMGYDLNSNYIYATRWDAGTSTYRLLRIGSDGVVLDAGPITGGGINAGAGIATGVIGADGFYYVKSNGSTSEMWRVDLSTRTATHIALSQAIANADFAWNNGLIYTHNHLDGVVYSIDPGTGTVNTVGPAGVPSGVFGSLVSASNGVFGRDNATGGFYRFNLTTGVATLISDGPTGGGDGAKCPTTAVEFPADLAIDKDDGSDTYMPGEDVVYTIVVSNLGPFGVADATVDDPLPAGIATASWTCGSGTGGGVCGVASGSGAIAGVPVNLPAGATVTFTLTLSVPSDFTGDLVNVATVTSPADSPDPNPGNNTDDDIDVTPVITVNKSVDPAGGTAVSPGDMLTYTLTVDVVGSATVEAEVLTDTLGAGLTAGTMPAGCVASGQVVTCTLAAGAAIGTHTFTYTATVDADAQTQVENSVVPTNGVCETCTTVNPVDPTVLVNKSVDVGDGTAVSVGDTLTYTLTVEVANAVTAAAEVVTDTLGTGLTVGTMPAGCTNAGQVVTCTLAAGAAIGTHSFVYTATVNEDATTQVENNVEPSTGTCGDCTTVNPVDPTILVDKSVDPASGTPVSVGDTLTYTLTVEVANAVTTADELLSDTLGAGLAAGPMPAGCTNAGQAITCTLAAGAAIGTHTFVYTATVNEDAEAQVENSVEPGTGVCGTCTTVNPVDPTVVVNKSVDVAPGASVAIGDTLTYTLTARVDNAATSADEILTDTLGTGLTAGTLPAGCMATGQVITCTLAAGAAIGTHSFVYTATVNEDATAQVENNVEPGTGICEVCSIITPVDPTIRTGKSVDVGNGTPVAVGDTLTYTLTAVVANAATTEAEVMTDTLGAGLTAGPMPAGCTNAGQVITCTLAAGSPIGTYTFTYTATVDADAETEVSNEVVPTNAICETCTTVNPLDPTITTNKSVDVGSGTAVSVGDTLTYTLTAVVANAATTEAEVMTDTLGAGLTLGTVPAGCVASGQVVTCTVPTGSAIGTYTFAYTATVDADAQTQVENNVEPTNGICQTCGTVNPVDPTVTINKSVDVGNGTEVAVGDILTYTITATVANATSTDPEVLIDTLGAGLTLGPMPAGCTASGQVVTCTLAAGAAIGTHTFTYTATVNEAARTQVENSVEPSSGVCGTCTTVNPLTPTITVGKSVDVGSGTAVSVGDTLTYTLTAVVANAATTEAEILTDTLGAGLTLGTVPAGCAASGQVVTCTVPTGSAIGTYAFAYTATVDADAQTQVENSVEPTKGTCETCATVNPLTPRITVNKSVGPASGTEVSAGDTLTYTLTVDVATAATVDPEVMTDTLGDGLTVGTLPDGCAATGQVITCTLAPGAAIGTHTFEYTATVDLDAATEVSNSVTTSTGACETCTTTNPVISKVLVNKTSNPEDGTEVAVGDVITYTVTVTVASGATTEALLLSDTLSAGQTLLADSIAIPAGGDCSVVATGLECTLAAGALPGVHTFIYQAQVAPDAVGDIGNVVTATGSGGDEPECTDCSTEHPLAEPVITIAKAADPDDGEEVGVGDTLMYTLSVTIEKAALTMPVLLHDTPGAGLTVGALPAGCANGAGQIVCTVDAGTVPGVYTFTYPATVNADALGEVANAVVSEYDGTIEAVCQPCGTVHKLADAPELRIAKAAGVRTANIGDLVRYTVTVENVGVVNVRGATVIDAPPAGFSYVEGSMAVEDGDGVFDLAPSQSPLRIGGLDVAAGESATIVYLLRVGAGVRHGTQVNTAQAQDAAGDAISNTATAQVSVEADPLLDDSLIFGTVFNDRDGDGWQDSAALNGVRVQGGFAPGAYVAGSTTLDRGTGAEPVADASAPLLSGIAVGEIVARQSEADPGPQVVIRQRLREAAFTDDFVLTSDEGVTVRMDAAGTTTVDQSGAAAKGLNAAAPTVERRIAQGEGGVVVDYVIGNAGIDERGIPGVRIASVDGLLIETDQYGRYHLADVQGGTRGHRNFILKLDPSTLPPGTPLTTDNPLVRRITPGLPVRFDFGAQLPAEPIPGGTEAVELTLGEVIFAPGSAAIRSEYAPAIAKMAEHVDAYGGGEVVITANGDSQALAFDRASAMREALLAQVAPEHRSALTVSVHTDVHDLVAGVTEGGALLGTVLFDTDRAQIRPEFAPLLERVAARLEAMGGGAIAVVGHADVRGSHAYNAELGLRRARAVYQALAERLSPQARAQVRVESSNDPTAPVGPERK
ncbi:OmpA family protein [Luteimonas sp. RD2P54]|uniref:OmpA family protein n=1 Tax=Luteimonas endophytica TaxID=3042023 RepID=A0ABT6JAP7_9GAMM|nr:OmpA family protein [Luteimonas endophytica]MDH5823899.1 OmpA family protein [Luteimonas endophytica]